MELTVDVGKGYVPASMNRPSDAPIGLIPVDSIYSPVYRVKYSIENTRVGKFTNYDKLVLEVWTDGTVDPEMALVGVSFTSFSSSISASAKSPVVSSRRSRLTTAFT